MRRGTPSAPGHRDIADPAGPDAEASGVEGATEEQLDRLVAVPAEFDDHAVRGEQGQGELQPS